jgi:hypothetical protein
MRRQNPETLALFARCSYDLDIEYWEDWANICKRGLQRSALSGLVKDLEYNGLDNGHE